MQTVGVLELVDHDRAEAQLLRLAHARVVAQEVAREQLKVFEVERGLTLLRGRVLVGEQIEQLLQELAVASRELLERRVLHAVACSAKLGRAVAACGKLEVEQLLGVGTERERGVGGRELILGRLGIGGEHLRGGLQLGEALGHAGLLAEVERQVAPRRAKRLVDAGQHPPQPGRAVGREQAHTLGVASGAERRQRTLECLAPDHGAVLVVELAEARIDSHRERVRAQEPRAEAVDGGDPGAVEPPREIVATARVQRRANAGTQLTRGLARVGDDEHRLDVEALVAHRAHEPLDEHGRLAGSRSGRDEDLAGCLDSSALLLVHGRSTRHIVHRSHHVGHVPPFGSWRTSPERMRCA